MVLIMFKIKNIKESAYSFYVQALQEGAEAEAKTEDKPEDMALD
jgi:hypothetical protein